MKKNMGTIDRSVRILAALAIAALLIAGTLSETWAFILGIVAILFLVTSSIGFCPGYLPFKISTRKNPPTA